MESVGLPGGGLSPLRALRRAFKSSSHVRRDDAEPSEASSDCRSDGEEAVVVPWKVGVRLRDELYVELRPARVLQLLGEGALSAAGEASIVEEGRE